MARLCVASYAPNRAAPAMRLLAALIKVWPSVGVNLAENDQKSNVDDERIEVSNRNAGAAGIHGGAVRR